MNKAISLFSLIIFLSLFSSCHLNEQSKHEKIEINDLLGGWRVVEKGWLNPYGNKSIRHSIKSGEGWNQYYFTQDSLYQMEYPIDLFRGENYNLFDDLIVGERDRGGRIRKNYYRVRFDHDTLLLLEFYKEANSPYYDTHLVRADLKEDSVKFLNYNKVDWNKFKDKWVLSQGVSAARPETFSCGFIEPKYLNLYKNDSTVLFKRDTLYYLNKHDTLCFQFGGYHGNHLNDRWTIHNFYLTHFCNLDTNCNGYGVPIDYDSGYE